MLGMCIALGVCAQGAGAQGPEGFAASVPPQLQAEADSAFQHVPYFIWVTAPGPFTSTNAYSMLEIPLAFAVNPRMPATPFATRLQLEWLDQRGKRQTMSATLVGQIDGQWRAYGGIVPALYHLYGEGTARLFLIRADQQRRARANAISNTVYARVVLPCDTCPRGPPIR